MKHISVIITMSCLFFGSVTAETLKAEKSSDALTTSTVTVSGLVKNELNVTLSDLENYNQVTLREVPMRCSETKLKSEGDDYQGVLLRELIKDAQVNIVNHREKNMIYFAAKASDNYNVLFSWHEIMNTKIGERVLVYIRKNQNTLSEDEGYIALISGHDTFTCSRHVKWLKEIAVMRLVL